jgi:Xaa-Pro aminopeptidase
MILEQQGVLASAERAMQRHGWQAVIAMSPENFRYLAATYVPSQSIIRRRHAGAVLFRTGTPVLVVVDIEEGFVRSTARIADVRPYNQFTNSCVETVAKALLERGITSGIVGVEFDFIPTSEMAKLQQAMPSVSFVDAREFFSGLRTIKRPEEIEALSTINRIAETIHQETYSGLRPGMTEKQIEKQIIDRFGELGGDRLVMLAVTSGPRSSYLNASASDRALEKGDVVRIDIIGTKDGYYSDICRTGIVGKAPAGYLAIWDTLIESRRLIEEKIRPGADTRDIYKTYGDYVTSKGIAPINFVGHGIGLTIHEEPYISRYISSILKPGMVMCVEPLYAVDGKYGFQLEDLILITESGFEYVTGGKKSEQLIQS